MFTGIHILEPRVFDYIPRGVYSDIVPTFYSSGDRKRAKDRGACDRQRMVRAFDDSDDTWIYRLRMMNGANVYIGQPM